MLIAEVAPPVVVGISIELSPTCVTVPEDLLAVLPCNDPRGASLDVEEPFIDDEVLVPALLRVVTDERVLVGREEEYVELVGLESLPAPEDIEESLPVSVEISVKELTTVINSVIVAH